MSRSIFSGFNLRSRAAADREEPDEWLLDAARKAGHVLPPGERAAGISAWNVLLHASLSDADVLLIACTATGVEPADFSRASPSLASTLPHAEALRYRVAPVGIHDGILDIATSNPRSSALERELAFAAKQRVRLRAASPSDIIRAQGMIYGSVTASAGGDPGDALTPAPPVVAPATVMQPRPAPVARLSMSTPVAEPAATATADAGNDASDLAERTPGEMSAALTGEAGSEPSAAATSATSATPATPAAGPPPDLSDRLLATAAAERAAEVVLEPQEDGGVLVRVSIDGIFSDRFRIPVAHAGRLMAALKRRASLDVAETSRGQQGRFTCDAADGPVAVRVATVPATTGRERLLLRLRTRHDVRDLAELGYTRDEHHRVQTLLAAGSGLVVVAGPAGAGRTTTLYAVARELQRAERLDRTIEELIELTVVDGGQTELRDSPHPTMAAAVRALVAVEGGALVLGAPLDALTLAQCDPELGMRRLVIASTGAGDAPAAVARLRKLHLDRDRLVESLTGIVAQRLVRRLCDACALPQAVGDLPEQQRQLVSGLPTTRMRRPEGCAACRGTGYRGRSAIVEVLAITPEVRDAIAREASDAELASLARARGMPSLWDSGLHRVLEGETSLAELLDVVPAPVASGGAVPQEDIDSLLSQLLGSPLVPARPRKPVPTRPQRSTPPAPAPATPAIAAHPVMPHEPVVEPEADVADAVAMVTDAPADVGAPSMDRVPGIVRVLLVNDDSSVRRALARGLTDAGLHVLQVADGHAAVAFVRRLRPDVVLTEVALPRMDAIGLLGALDGPDAPPVVVHTEQVDESLDSWLRESGARDVLHHDLSIDALVQRLRELVYPDSAS